MKSKILDIIKEDIGQDDVFSIRAAISPLFMMITWQSVGTKNPFHIAVLNRNRDSHLILNEKKYISVATDVAKDYFNNNVTLESLRNNYNDLIKKTEVLYYANISRDWSLVSEKEIIEVLNQARVLFDRMANETIYIENVDYEKILNIIGLSNQPILDKVWARATIPVFASFDQRRMGIILGLKSDKDLIKKVKYIYTDYFCSKSEEEISVILKDIFNNYDTELNKYQEIERALQKKKEDFESWIKTLDQKSAKIANFTQTVMFMRDDRKDMIAQVQALMSDLAIEIFSRLQIPAENAPYVLLYELVKGFDYIKSIKDKILKRKDGVMYLLKSDYSFVVEECNFDEANAELEAYIKSKNSYGKELKGQIACRGVVRATAKVINDPKDDKGFKAGEILVTSMTRPEFVPLMKKAGAVVTNEGGITCHAAIISRELNIPCVIGTRVATQAIKDGDLVEVDANSGIVRIL